MKFFWTDTETTGLDPVKNAIIQIAGIIVIDGKEEEKFNLKCRPNDTDEVDQKALDVHGMTKEEIMTYPNPKNVYTKLKAIFDKYINKFDKMDKFFAAGKNVQFDLNFLNEFFRKNGTPNKKYNCDGDPFFFSYVHSAKFEVETLAMQYEMKKKRKIFDSYKLENLCNKVGIQLSNAHDAMADIEASREIANFFWKEIARAEN